MSTDEINKAKQDFYNRANLPDDKSELEALLKQHFEKRRKLEYCRVYTKLHDCHILEAAASYNKAIEALPSYDDLAAQLAAAQQRIAELEAALKDSLNICRQPLAGNTMRARYDSMLDQQARIMEIASKALKGTQS